MAGAMEKTSSNDGFLFDKSAPEIDVDDMILKTVPSTNQPPAAVMDEHPKYVSQEDLVRILKRQDELEEMVKRDRAKLQEVMGNNDVREGENHELVGLVLSNTEEEEPEDDVEDHEWQESVYTLLYVCRANSQAFCYALFVVGLQITTIALTLFGILDLDSATNPLVLPAMVDPVVTATQGVTIFLGLAFQSDLIEAVLKLEDGYFPEILDKHPGATYNTWLFSCLVQLVAGTLLLATIFILTMQVEDVLSIMLNFAALHFMAEIDDIGFYLGQKGFITNQLRREVCSVCAFEVLQKRKTRRISRRVLYIMALIGLFVGYAILKMKQLEGEYLPTNIYVQFSDAYDHKIPYYSGILVTEKKITPLRRTYRDAGTQDILLGYCDREKAWTFAQNTNDPCDYFAKSPESTTYVVTSIPGSQWQVKDRFHRLHPFDSFSLVDRNCNPQTCQGRCEDKDGLCHCDPNTFGMDCEFSNVCPELVTDERFEPFPAVKVIPSKDPDKEYDGSAVSQAFKLLKNPDTGQYVTAYDFPVYYSNETFPANIIFFAGRRWIITTEWDLFNLTEARDHNREQRFFPRKTAQVLENTFHGYHNAQYTPLFMSDPVDFGTPRFFPSPIGLQWWLVTTADKAKRLYKPDAPVTTVLTCSRPQLSCLGQDDEYFCLNGGSCNKETGVCDCSSDNHGDRCEHENACYATPAPCNHNGVCDDGKGASGSCQCNLPWYGKLCKEHYKCYEASGECKSNGICDTVTGKCECPNDPAISGYTCEKRADCLFFGCANAGICGAWNGECVCRPPFYGTLCELIDQSHLEMFCSRDEDCRNGECIIETGLCACANPSSFGTLCEHQFNCTEVAKNQWQPTCQNLGTCNDATGICDCPHPYFGPDCSQVPPCLRDEDCSSQDDGSNVAGGTCNLDTGTCDCVLGPAAGKRCERQLWCASDDDCNLGYCDVFYGTCKCPLGSGGRFCETYVVGMYPVVWDDGQQSFKEGVLRCGIDNMWGKHLCE